jgi:hypothetical protein
MKNDKCDIGMPNELLNLFEEGSFPIPELLREVDVSDEPLQQSPPTSVEVATCESSVRAKVVEGRVRCKEFPLIVMTSNGERDFPPAFNRRCIRINMPDPTKDEEMLRKIVAHQLCPEASRDGDSFTETEHSLIARVKAAMDAFAIEAESARSKRDYLSVDQLLNLAFLLEHGVQAPAEPSPDAPDGDFDRLRRVLLQALNASN